MHWLMAFLGLFAGAIAGGIDEAFLGMVAGALIGWQGARIAQLRRRIKDVEDALVARPEPAGAQPSQAAAAARPAPTPQPFTPPAPVATTPSAPIETLEPTAADAETEAEDIDVAPSAPAAARAVFTSREPSAVASTVPPEVRERIAAASTSARRDEAQAAMPRAPQEPDFADRIGATLKRWLFEGNVPVKLGMLVLFFGVAAALKYVVDQGYVSFPIEFRLAAIAAAAVGGLIWGWRNREARPAFGLSLQGGAIGVLLLTVFAAYRLYALLPAGVAFGVVLVLVAGAAALAVLQNNLWLALLGFLGGYLAPVLISTGSGNHVALFSYYALLNAAVFAIAWLRSWRALNLVGFVFTFVVGTLWGAKYYRPEHFATVEPFLILFFLFYIGIAVLYALRQPQGRRALVDGTLVFGTPLIVFPLQAALLGDDRMSLAYSALAMAMLYAVLAAWLMRRRGVEVLGQSFAALAVGFATLAVPLALSARWTSASWALEGAALVWLGLRQQRFLPKLAGWALQGLAGAAYMFSLLDRSWLAEPGEMAIINGHALGVACMALAAFVLSWLHERNNGNRLLIWLGFVVGTFWWGVAGIRELTVHWTLMEASLGLVAFAALTVALAAIGRGLIPWPRLGWLVVGVAIAGPLLVMGTIVELDGPANLRAHGYWLVWIGAMVWGLWALREPHQKGISLAHVFVLAALAWLYGATLHQLASEYELDDGWRYVAGLLPLIALLLATWRVPALGAFPLASEFSRYRLRWFVPAGFALIVGWIAALGERGGSDPLPYLPLLNPIELFQLALLLVAYGVVRRMKDGDETLRNALPLAAFAFLSFAGLRAVHHYTGVPWSPMILNSGTAQTVLTVLWSFVGVALWVIGSRQQRWNLWVAGAILMGVVLAKLVFVDRQYVGNLAGIVSFMAVGALLVLVGRIAPTPPRTRESVATEPESEA